MIAGCSLSLPLRAEMDGQEEVGLFAVGTNGDLRLRSQASHVSRILEGALRAEIEEYSGTQTP